MKFLSDKCRYRYPHLKVMSIFPVLIGMFRIFAAIARLIPLRHREANPENGEVAGLLARK